MKNINIYGHYGSHNHGNEAIVRGLGKLLDNRAISLYSYNPDTDFTFQLDEVCEIRNFLANYHKFSSKYIKAKLLSKINNKLVYTYLLGDITKKSGELFLFEAGDQYCEESKLTNFYSHVNKILSMKNRLIALPCTISAEKLRDSAFVNRLKYYNIIFARESITYQALKNTEFEEIARFSPCPAFIMTPQTVDLPDIFSDETVGITIGHLSQGKEAFTDKLVEKIKALIKFILESTNYNIALIPHVNVGSNLSDVIILKTIASDFLSSKRIKLIPEQRADSIKYIISKCSLLVTLRTHASVSGYSTCTPTLVIGYSQSQKGSR